MSPSKTLDKEDWETTAHICRNVLEQSIPHQWALDSAKLPPKGRLNVIDVPYESGLLTTRELEITEKGVSDLLACYQNGKLTVEEVTTAFLKRAVIGQQLLNFAVEFLADTALETARKLDANFKATGKLCGPLHGIPISVKEHVAIGGRICNASFVARISNVAKEDAHIVKLLKNAGAVIHVRTNQPQSLMHIDTCNNITGQTLNPYNRLLSPGGSSGGEGAAVGFKCSVLGVGTDIGGSIRVPAAFNNVYGLRPTALRNPSLGLFGINAGQESIRGCVGPLGQSIDDIWVFQKALLDQKPWDLETSLVPLPWRELEAPTTLTVGIMMDDGVITPHPPITRALNIARSKLQQANINVVEWEPYKHDYGWEIISKLFMPDAGTRLRGVLAESGEPALPLTEHAIAMSTSKPLSIDDNWALNFQREAYRREYHALMKARGVDVILCPAYLSAGALIDEGKYWTYTAVWNILDQPGITFPTGLNVDKQIDVVETKFTPKSAWDQKEWDAYSPNLLDTFPISLQLVGKHFQDEELLQAAKIVEKAIRS